LPEIVEIKLTKKSKQHFFHLWPIDCSTLLVVAGCYFSTNLILCRKILDKYDAKIVFFMPKTTNHLIFMTPTLIKAYSSPLL